jgi:saccharopine dehydrogenase (NAD+, L-lysine-forming)
VYAVVVAAGPFVYTSKQFVDACIRTKTHYLDITGEWEVFEAILKRNQEAMDVGVALIPGVGMDVVPTDCLASKLKGALPSATHLQMALLPSGAAISPGTMKTVLLAFGKPPQARKNGEIATNTKPMLDFNNPELGTVHTTALTWGDISTAYASTGIPNIGMYLLSSPQNAEFMNSWKGSTLKWLASWGLVRWAINKGIESFVSGPTEQQNRESRVHFQGIAWDEKTRQMAEVSLTTAEGYRFTALSMVAAAHKLGTSHKGLSGALTPSQAFGTDYVLEFENSKWGDVTVRTAGPNEIENRSF